MSSKSICNFFGHFVFKNELNLQLGLHARTDRQTDEQTHANS